MHVFGGLVLLIKPKMVAIILLGLIGCTQASDTSSVLYGLTPEEAYEDELRQELARTLLSDSGKGLDGLVSEDIYIFDMPGNYGVTSIYWAVVSNNTEGLRFLLERGAEANVVYEDGTSPLYWALLSSNDELYKLLLDFGALVNICEYNTGCEVPALNVITSKGDHDKTLSRFKVLYDNGLDLSTKHENGTIFSRIVYLGRFDMVLFLISERKISLGENEIALLKKYLLIKKDAYTFLHPMYDEMMEVDKLLNGM